jgi:uncharacterized protein (TIGR03435 family)
MRSDEKNDHILDRALTRHANLEQQDIDAAMDRAWTGLQSEMSTTKEWQMALPRTNRKFGLPWRFAVIAAAAAIVVSLVVVRNSTERTDAIKVGDTVRAIEQGSSEYSLPDTSRVELRSQSEISVEQASDGIAVHLRKGGIIVHAANQANGHLYVTTKDVTVSVVGTVFFVNAEEEGSRVAVIEGEVRVQQGQTTKNLKPGQQMSTNPKMESLQVEDELAWSREAETHVALLQQTAPPPAPPKKLEFEAATVKSVPFREMPMDIKCRGADGPWSARSNPGTVDPAVVAQGRCTGTIPIADLFRIAYGVTARRLVSGLAPDAAAFEAYQIDAKAEDVRTVTVGQLREMLQNLIRDRFKIQSHRETKQEDGYALRIADGGIRFKETQELEQNPFGTGLRMQPACYWCLKGNFSLNSLADILEYFMVRDKPVINATGLSGIYDITLMLYRIEPIRDGAGAQRGASGNGIPIEFDPSLAKSLEDQLGLRLERGRIAIERVVIDHFERPGEN